MTSADYAEGISSTPRAKRGPSKKGEAARRELLAAAEKCLRKYGYGGISTRQVAMVADAPMSQIHYHFGSKQGLLLALFEDLNSRLLHRQTLMFASDLPLWRQWELACDYLDEDLASGYVRILNELAAAGWSDREIGDAVRKAVSGWKHLLTNVARRAEERFGGFGPLDPEDVAALVSSVFLGAEMNILSGHENPDVPVRRALRRFGALIRQFEENAAKGE
ncbi:MAG: TetR/AcrR family transcriptional regulator [Boseongicola sp.]|nr:TetR/AcrR family transcriptional regulator [Boseongicola sp.]MDD9977141.1 TetR/AcrR family transcriptional regulator [Boseongicola sp.]